MKLGVVPVSKPIMSVKEAAVTKGKRHKPTLDDMNESQTSCYYDEGYYYMGVVCRKLKIKT